MIKSASIFTEELDDSRVAIDQLQKQLDEKLNLLSNSIGIIMCDPEFIETGVYKEVCEAFPFPLVGSTTMSQGVNGESGMLILTIMVLTSDDVFFSAGHSKPIPNTIQDKMIYLATKDSYAEAAAKLPSAPKLAIIFPPLLSEVGGDRYVDAFHMLCPNVPVFGTLAIDDSLDFSGCASLFDGESDNESLSYVLLSGNVSPRFVVGTVSENNTLPYAGEITKSEAHIVYEINDMPTSKYFESIGLASNGQLNDGLSFVPMLIDFKNKDDYDGVPVIRAMLYLDETGAGICRGYMYQNSTMSLSSPTKEDIIFTSGGLVDKINAMEDKQAVLIFSCMVRRMTLGTDALAEVTMIDEKYNSDVPYMLGYAGGEICPTSISEGSATNRFHNFSIIACIL